MGKDRHAGKAGWSYLEVSKCNRVIMLDKAAQTPSNSEKMNTINYLVEIIQNTLILVTVVWFVLELHLLDPVEVAVDVAVGRPGFGGVGRRVFVAIARVVCVESRVGRDKLLPHVA